MFSKPLLFFIHVLSHLKRNWTRSMCNCQTVFSETDKSAPGGRPFDGFWAPCLQELRSQGQGDEGPRPTGGDSVAQKMLRFLKSSSGCKTTCWTDLSQIIICFHQKKFVHVIFESCSAMWDPPFNGSRF